MTSSVRKAGDTTSGCPMPTERVGEGQAGPSAENLAKAEELLCDFVTGADKSAAKLRWQVALALEEAEIKGALQPEGWTKRMHDAERALRASEAALAEAQRRADIEHVRFGKLEETEAALATMAKERDFALETAEGLRRGYKLLEDAFQTTRAEATKAVEIIRDLLVVVDTSPGAIFTVKTVNAARTLAAIRAPRQAEPETFQQRVAAWMLACFGAEIAADRMERNHRFLEEALELVQANGCTESEAAQLVGYVYGRPAGELHQECGGVGVTLAALCSASGLDMDRAAEDELARVWGKIEQIRAKQAAKPKHSPLPSSPPPPSKKLEHDPECAVVHGGRRGCTCGAVERAKAPPPSEEPSTGRETCRDCGRVQWLVWGAEQGLWIKFSGGQAILCPECFDKRAARQGRLLTWTATLHPAVPSPEPAREEPSE
jgi:hypothetical protein